MDHSRRKSGEYIGLSATLLIRGPIVSFWGTALLLFQSLFVGWEADSTHVIQVKKFILIRLEMVTRFDFSLNQ